MVEDKSLKFKYWDHTGTVLDLIKKWKPRNCKTHKQYQNSLYQYLDQRLKKVNVTKEYGDGRIRGDIALDRKLMVEIKVNFDTTAKFQRAIGQIEGYIENNWAVIVVICGRRDKNLVKQLRDKYEGTSLWEETFGVVEKGLK